MLGWDCRLTGFGTHHLTGVQVGKAASCQESSGIELKYQSIYNTHGFGWVWLGRRKTGVLSFWSPSMAQGFTYGDGYT